ncbi:MAG: HD domain-containing protein, partial [Acidobacteria bacterium]
MIKPLTRAGKATFAVVNVAGTLLYAWAVSSVVAEQAAGPSWSYLALLAAAMALGWASIKLPGINSLISVSDALVFSSVMFFGPVHGALIAGTEGFLATRRHSSRLLSAFSSLSVLTMSTLAAGGVYLKTLAWTAPQRVSAPDPVSAFVALGAMALTHYLINSWLVAILTAAARRTSAWRLWKDSYVWTSVSFFAGAAAAGLAYVLVRAAGIAGLAVTVPIAAFTYAAYRVYLGRVEEQNRRIAAMNEVHLQTIQALAMAIDAKGQSSPGHLLRVQAYAVGLAELYRVDETVLEGIRAAALLHDVGKIAVPDYIINKPGRLTPAERKKVQSYPAFGAEILRDVAFPYPVVPFIRHHRERWDGSGYPDGLAGEAIPLGARILSLADAADAMMSARSWREPLEPEEALRAIRDQAGKSFDPKLVKLFCAHFEELHAAACSVQPPAAHGLEEISAGLREHAEALYRAGVERGVLEDIVATRREAIAMWDLARDLGSSVGLEETLKIVIARLRRLVDFDTGVVYLFDDDSRLIVPAY